MDKTRHDKVSVTMKIRRLRRLRDALKVGLDNCKIPEGSWKASSFSASPSKVIDVLERVRYGGTLVLYLESDAGGKNGVNLAV